MQDVEIPMTDNKYKAVFPPKCVYCGAPQAVTMRKTGSSKTGQRRRYVTADVPYCAEHARESKRNARILTAGLIAMFIVSCGVLFGVTTSINRNPSVGLLVFLGLIAVALAFAGRELLRRRLVRSRATMADMVGSDLGFKVKPVGDKVVFSFANGRIADEFARLNGQTSANELKGG